MKNNPVWHGDLPQSYSVVTGLPADLETRLLSQASGALGLHPRQIELRQLVRVMRIVFDRQFGNSGVLSFD